MPQVSRPTLAELLSRHSLAEGARGEHGGQEEEREVRLFHDSNVIDHGIIRRLTSFLFSYERNIVCCDELFITHSCDGKRKSMQIVASLRSHSGWRFNQFLITEV